MRFLACPIILFLVLSFEQEAHALSCKHRSLNEAFHKYDAAFVGKVKGTEKVGNRLPKSMGSAGYVSDKVTFAVDRSWKGVESAELTLSIRNFPGYWDNVFERSQFYLVFARQSKDEMGLEFPVCGTFKRLQPDYAFVEELNRIGQPKEWNHGNK